MGLLVSVVGYGLYRSPRLDWAEFTDTCFVLIQGVASELSRFIEDPIAFVGLITLLGGLVLTYNGLKEFIFGRPITFSEIWTGKKEKTD